MNGMRVGVHASVRRGFSSAIHEAAALGCDTLQIFTQSPSLWQTHVHTDADFAAFRAARAEHGMSPVVVHSPYLPNLCTSNEDMYQRSLRALKEDLACVEKLGAEYLVVHPGAYSPDATPETGYARAAAAFREALDAHPGGSMILIENMAGGGRRIGGPFREIAELIRLTDRDARMGVCFDTCHAYGAGYDLRTPAAVEATLAEFDREVGLARIRVFHVNDSAGPLKSHRDLHQSLGEGEIGLDGFRALFSNSHFSDCALILETPKLPMPQSDLDNLKRLRACLPAAAAGRPQ